MGRENGVWVEFWGIGRASVYRIIVMLVVGFNVSRRGACHLCDFTICIPCPDTTGNPKVTERIPSQFSGLVILYTNTPHQVAPMIIPFLSC